MSDQNNNIELRSEKVRSIIGQIPPRIIRSGISVIFIVFIILMAGTYFFEYPDTYKTEISINTNPEYSDFTAKSNCSVQYLAKDKQLVSKNDIVAVLSYSDNNIKKDTVFAQISGIFSCSGLSEIKKGEQIFGILPEKITGYYADILLPVSIMKKIKINTDINIEFESYPKSKFGIIKAKITEKYSLPIKKASEIFFRAKISLSDTLITNQGKKIEYYPQIRTRATIQIDKKSLFHRIIENMLSV